MVASSPEGGAVFSSLSGLPCSGLVAAVKSMKPEEHVQLLLSPECEYMALWFHKPVMWPATCFRLLV